MKLFYYSILLIPCLAFAGESGLKILDTRTAASSPGPSEYFSGRVAVTMILSSTDSTTLSSASVKFEPAARTAWHTHPKGQLLIVTDGKGLIQTSGEAAQTIKKGDVIWTPPGVKHWHGAAPDSSMIHTAVQEYEAGKNVSWLEKVTDAEYQKATR